MFQTYKRFYLFSWTLKWVSVSNDLKDKNSKKIMKHSLSSKFVWYLYFRIYSDVKYMAIAYG